MAADLPVVRVQQDDQVVVVVEGELAAVAAGGVERQQVTGADPLFGLLAHLLAADVEQGPQVVVDELGELGVGLLAGRALDAFEADAQEFQVVVAAQFFLLLLEGRAALDQGENALGDHPQAVGPAQVGDVLGVTLDDALEEALEVVARRAVDLAEVEQVLAPGLDLLRPDLALEDLAELPGLLLAQAKQQVVDQHGEVLEDGAQPADGVFTAA